MTLMRFDNKFVLVTGGSRGIGRETAILFAQQGATVAVHYNSNRAAAEEALALLDGEGHMVVQADQGNPDQIKSCVDEVMGAFGRIDILINNAAVYEDHPLDSSTYEHWQKSWKWVIDTNLHGAANFSYCVGQHMIKEGAGRIVNVSSRGAFRGEPTSPAYGASKAALNSMSQSLAKHLGEHGIFVGVIAPGFVKTEMAESILSTPRGESIRRDSPLNRVATVTEIAYPILFLASEGAEWLTGAVLDANGASYLRT